MLKTIAKLFSYGCIHCGEVLTNKKKVMCRLCEHYLKESAPMNSGVVISAVSYSAPEAKSLIFYMKENNDPYVFNYAAKLISEKIRKCDLLEYLSDFYITYAPRSTKSLFKYHFDQSREIADFLSIELFNEDNRVVSLFKRNPFSEEQKKLSSRHRAENAAELFSLKKNISLPEKVLIVDDVFTTGATLFALRDILLAEGVKECVLCTVAINDRKSDYS